MVPVIDASALLAVVLGEAGDALVLKNLRRAPISAVNLSECFSRAVERGNSAERVDGLLRRLEMEIVPFSAVHARSAAELRPATKHLGLSLGDRACLVLTRERGGILFTGDRRLASFESDIDIRMIR